ncbi:MAG: SGNH/GDSL hydrolase family protein [Planctomycetes bacterium]|nr:SGNH/GDSL hydrolase family protein [Planctomycetota bacterium]
MSREVKALELDPHMAIRREQGGEAVWRDACEKPLALSGFCWFEQDRLYRRLPLQPSVSIPESVSSLANCTAGGTIRFRSDSTAVFLRFELSGGPVGMDHMPATGQCGFDLYLKSGAADRFCGVTRLNTKDRQYTARLFEAKTAELRDFTIHFPLYQGVVRVELGFDAGARIEAPRDRRVPGRLLFYGTSITQGGCASRPGMAYTNILSRRLDVETVNLGFSGNGRGEPELARLICEVDHLNAVVLDYEANAGSTQMQTLPPFVDILRRHALELPILVLSRIPFAPDLRDSECYDRFRELASKQREFVEERRKAGDRHIHFFDGLGLLPRAIADECTVDGVHATDLGFLHMAEALQPVLRGLLG